MDEKTSIVSLDDLNDGPKEKFPCLVVLSGQAAGRVFPLQTQAATIGRGTDVEIRLEDDGVSRRHAQVFRLPDGAVCVEDLHSTNGTFVNGEKKTTHQLHDGDKIRIGSTTILKFSYTDRDEEAYQNNLYDQATKDAMTGCYNKKFFGERLQAEFAYASRQNEPVSLAMMDLDHFKNVNDTFGHPAGDAILKHFAALVLKTVRAEDLVCRYGGEEFAIIFRKTPQSEAAAIAERVRSRMQVSICDFQGTKIPMTVSIGVTTHQATRFATALDFMKRADQLLYKAKQGGRNRVVMA